MQIQGALGLLLSSRLQLVIFFRRRVDVPESNKREESGFDGPQLDSDVIRFQVEWQISSPRSEARARARTHARAYSFAASREHSRALCRYKFHRNLLCHRRRRVYDCSGVTMYHDVIDF